MVDCLETGKLRACTGIDLRFLHFESIYNSEVHMFAYFFQSAFLCCPPNIVYSLIIYNPVSVIALLLYRLNPVYLHYFRVMSIKLC
jgi:hypothetical protein